MLKSLKIIGITIGIYLLLPIAVVYATIEERRFEKYFK